MKFCENLKRLRVRSKISQIELGKMLDVNQYVISYWEKGRSEPSISQLIKLSEIFDIPADYLLGRGIIRTENEQEFLNAIKNIELDAKNELTDELTVFLNRLNDNQKNCIIEFIKSFIDANDEE